MKKIKVNTGFGYFTDTEGHIVSKYELPRGEHPIKDKFNAYEVATKEELDAIEVYQPPETPEQAKERKIKAEEKRILREQAIANLKAKGEI